MVIITNMGVGEGGATVPAAEAAAFFCRRVLGNPTKESEWGGVMTAMALGAAMTFQDFTHHDSALQARLQELRWKRLQGSPVLPGALGGRGSIGPPGPPGPLVRLASTDRKSAPPAAVGWADEPAAFQKWKRDKAALKVVAEKSFTAWQVEMAAKEEKERLVEEDKQASLKMAARTEKLEKMAADPGKLMIQAVATAKKNKARLEDRPRRGVDIPDPRAHIPGAAWAQY